jgi:hypothetical protein
MEAVCIVNMHKDDVTNKDNQRNGNDNSVLNEVKFQTFSLMIFLNIKKTF